MSRKLPPLNAIRAFEAAARYGGYVSAAQELGVTPAAISHQVKNLEQFFGKLLFSRHNNSLTLTDDGAKVFADSAEALERLEKMTARMYESEVRTRLVISVLPSLATRWLNRVLNEYLALDPATYLDIRVESDPVDFERHNIDVRICYGSHLYTDHRTRVICQDSVQPMCTPLFLERHPIDVENPVSLLDEHLIHVNWPPSFVSHPTWADWFASVGSEHIPIPGRGHRCDMSALAVDLALVNAGFILGQQLLTVEEISTDRLITPFQQSIPLGHPYCVVCSHVKYKKPNVRHFVDWIDPICPPTDPRRL